MYSIHTNRISLGISRFFRNYISCWLSNHKLSTIISIILVIPVADKIMHFLFQALTLKTNNGFGFTEFLINYQSGFVRRGLLGELLYWFTSITSINVAIPIYVLCFSSLTFVFIYLLKKFANKGYCWWILFSPFICGYVDDIVRKDFLCYSILIITLLIINSHQIKLYLKLFATCFLTLICLLMHEAYIFWGTPIVVFCLWMITHKQRWIPIMCAVSFIATFLLLSYFKGSKEIGMAIVDSWNNLDPSLNLRFIEQNSIGALGWNLIDTIKKHGVYNFTNFGLFIKPLIYCIVYYFVNNFLLLFSKKESYTKQDRNNISALYLIVSLTMSPLFVALSCDYGRLYQYLTLSSLLPILIFKRDVISSCIPTSLLLKVNTLNNTIDKFLKPSKTSLLLILFFIADAAYSFSLENAFVNSIYGWYAVKLYSLLYSFV